MASLTKIQPKSALIEAGQQLLICQMEKAEAEKHEKALRAFILQGMKRNRLKSMILDNGVVFTIKDGSRKVVIKDREKAEAFLDEYDCWKLDSAKLLKIFGRLLKVPPMFRIERGDQQLAIMSPKTKAYDY